MTNIPLNTTTRSELLKDQKTGEIKEMTSKIKPHADHAGPLPPPLLLNTLPAFKLTRKLTLPNKSSLIAQQLLLDTLTMDAMEVGITGLGTTLLIKEDLTGKKTTSTPLLMELANLTPKDSFQFKRDMLT